MGGWLFFTIFCFQKYSAAPIKCPVGFMLFTACLCTLGRPRIPLQSALGPMRRVFEVRLIAGNIYCHPDTSIKDMQLTEITSFASRWRLRLSDCLHTFLHIFNKTSLFFNSNTSFQICIEFPLSWCNQLFDCVKF